jgi:hypothetical protein
MAQDQEKVPLVLDNHRKETTADNGRADFGGHQPAEGRAEFGGVHGVLAASVNMEPFMGAVAASGGVAAQDALISQMFNLDSSNCFQK